MTEIVAQAQTERFILVEDEYEPHVLAETIVDKISAELLEIDSKKKLADVEISVNSTNAVQITYTSSREQWSNHINGVTTTNDELKCKLSVTEYGDMSSFLGQGDVET